MKKSDRNTRALIMLINRIYKAAREVGLRTRGKAIKVDFGLCFPIRGSKQKTVLAFETFQRNDSDALRISIIKDEIPLEIATKKVENVDVNWLKEHIQIALKKAKH